MKLLHSNKKPILLGFGIFAVLAIIFIFTTCDIGLGPIVNTEKPVIQNGDDGNGPGSFLQGSNNTIELNVENKLGFKIDEVFMEVEYIDKNTQERVRKKFPGHINPETGKWEVDLDTSEMKDGQIKAWVTAIDESGNDTTSTEITYFVKNKLPQIEMTIPVITTEKFDNDDFLNNLFSSDPVYRRFSLMGVATDDFGIWPGFPKIMIWPENNDNVDTDGLPRYENGRPTDAYGYWYQMEDIPSLNEKSTTATRFSWPMLNLKHDPTPLTAKSTYPEGGEYRLPKKTGENREEFLTLGKYRFRVWTKDRFGNDNYYPDRTDTTRPPENPSKKYIEIAYKSATSIAMADVTKYPLYYNMAVNLLVEILLEKNDVDISTQSNPVRAKITKTNDASANLPANILWEGAAIKDTETKYHLDISTATASTWTLLLPADNRLYIKTWVVDSKEEVAGPELTTYFIVDKTPPDLTIDRPILLTNSKAAGAFSDGGSYNILYPTIDSPPASATEPKWVTGIITVSGVPKDTGTNASGIKEILYHFGKLGDDTAANDTARKTIYDNAVWNDTLLNTPNPVKSDSIGGSWSGTQFSWTWTYNIFPDEFRQNNPTIVQLHTDLGYSSSSPKWESKRTDKVGSVRFYLPFYVKVVDNANNYRIIHYTLCVDPKMDEPIVTITQPEVKKEADGITDITPIVGGTVRVAGFATDNWWMHTALMRIKKSGVASYYLPPGATLFYPNNEYPAPLVEGTTTRDEAGWFKTNKIGDSNVVNWYANINGDKGLDPVSGVIEVSLEVVAIDCDENDLTHNTPHIVGPVEKLGVKFSKDVPLINNTKILKDNVADRPYSESIKTAGKFTFSMDVDATDDINTLSVRVNNSATVTTLIEENSVKPLTSSWVVGAKSTSGGRAKRNVKITVDSTKSPMISGLTLPGITYGNTGNLILEVTVTENTVDKLSTTNTFTIGVDNLYPTAVIQTPHIASENISNGKYYWVLGTAKDYSAGTELVQGLERVLVYFEKATISRPNSSTRTVTGSGSYIRPNGSDALNSEFTNYPDVLDHRGSTTTETTAPNTNPWLKYPVINYVQTIPDPAQSAWKAASAMVIDYAENNGTADPDGDGTKGEIWTGTSSSREWGARVDFAGWKDGPYIVHYLIMDQAGNAVHYQNDIYVKNNSPKIMTINFGTDINGSGTVTDGTSSSLNEYLYLNNSNPNLAANTPIDTSIVTSIAGSMSPSFRIRGNMFSVKLTYTGGNNTNGNIRAKVAYATQGDEAPASTMARGNLYEIKTFGTSNTDFTKYGAPNNITGTVFVATGPVTGGSTIATVGSVIPYNVTGTPATLNPAPTTATIDFSTFNVGWDSPKDGSGNITSNNVRFFIVKVYDATVASATNGADVELDQLSDALLVKLDIDNTDSKNPSIEFLPLGSEYYVNASALPPLNNPANNAAKTTRFISDADYNKNIYMDGDVRAGYVQYARDNQSGSTEIANISGKVKFLGRAEDNQRIASIWATITNYNSGNSFQIAHAGTDGFIVADTGADWEFKLLGDNTIKDYLTLDFGHTLSWEFMWDSSKVAGVARENVVITFQVRDAAARTNNSARTVNIVPYISEVRTSLSEIQSPGSVFNRSALGGYPVRDNEDIKIHGFNLGTFTANDNNNYARIGTGAANNITITSNNGSVMVANVSGKDSGTLDIAVNGIVSFNNRTEKAKSASYNQEKNGINNDILDNSRYMYVWQTGDLITGVAAISNPFMRLHSDGTRFISYGIYTGQSTGRLKVQRSDNAAATKQQTITLGTSYSNRMIYTTVAAGSNKSFYAAGSDLSSQNNRGFQIGRSNPAGDNNAAGNTISDAAGGNQTASGHFNLYGMADSNPDRFRIPRIAVQSTGATFNTTTGIITSGVRTSDKADRVLISYFDAKENEIRVIYGLIGDGTTSAHITDGTAGEIVASGTTSKKGSPYTAVGLLKNGTPVIAWYDADSKKLYLSYGNTPSKAADVSVSTSDGAGTGYPNTTATATWQSNAVEIDNGKGSYVDMAVDAADNVHLAYYSNAGGVYYALIPPTTTGTIRPNAANKQIFKVDTYLSAGTKLMLNVRKTGSNYVPYITYANASFPGTVNAVRVAWRVNFSAQSPGGPDVMNGTDANDRFIGNWEVMTVPVDHIPNSDEYVCNGVPYTTTGWYLTGTGLSSNTTAIDQSILVGYLTDTSFEGSILKGNILTVPLILQKP